MSSTTIYSSASITAISDRHDRVSEQYQELRPNHEHMAARLANTTNALDDVESEGDLLRAKQRYSNPQNQQRFPMSSVQSDRKLKESRHRRAWPSWRSCYLSRRHPPCHRTQTVPCAWWYQARQRYPSHRCHHRRLATRQQAHAWSGVVQYGPIYIVVLERLCSSHSATNMPSCKMRTQSHGIAPSPQVSPVAHLVVDPALMYVLASAIAARNWLLRWPLFHAQSPRPGSKGLEKENTAQFENHPRLQYQIAAI